MTFIITMTPRKKDGLVIVRKTTVNKIETPGRYGLKNYSHEWIVNGSKTGLWHKTRKQAIENHLKERGEL